MKIDHLEEFKIYEDLILICVNNSIDQGRDIYSAVRCAWRLSKTEVQKRELVLAYYKGDIVGAYRPKIWLPATKENFPELNEDLIKRIGFHGSPAMDVWTKYVGKSLTNRKIMTRRPYVYLDKNID